MPKAFLKRPNRLSKTSGARETCQAPGIENSFPLDCATRWGCRTSRTTSSTFFLEEGLICQLSKLRSLQKRAAYITKPQRLNHTAVGSKNKMEIVFATIVRSREREMFST